MGGGAVGGGPTADAQADRVQPSRSPEEDFASSVSVSDIVGNLGPWDAEEVRRCQTNLDRRLADQQLVEALTECKFKGPCYRRFEEELAAYALAVLRAWMYTGYIFKLAAGRGLHLYPVEAELDELARDSDARDELANMTVALALPKFRERALIRGGWQVEGGASIPTYFMGSCLYVFPNEFRRRRTSNRRWRQALWHKAVAPDPAINPLTNPAVVISSNISVVDDLERIKSERQRIIVALTIDGYSQEEIAEILDMSVRAVEGALYRWRAKEKQVMREGGERRG